MRYREFGGNKAVYISDGRVSVSTTAYTDVLRLINIKEKRKEFLSPWTARPNDRVGLEAHFFTTLYDRDIVGQLCLWDLRRRQETVCSISYWIEKNYSNLGITTIAVRLLTSHAFSAMNVSTIEAAIQPNNLASIRVAEKSGFVYAESVERYLYVDGAWRDHDIYVLHRPS